MNNDDLIDDWDEEDYEVFNQWDEEAKNKRLEELEEYFKSDMEIRAKLLIKIDGLNYSLEQANKEIEELKAEIKELNDDNVWWTNRFNAVERDNERLNNIIKEVKSQLDYLETYSSKEDVFEDMKRRLDRIDKIIGSDKE